MNPEEQVPTPGLDSSLFKRLLRYVSPYRGLMATATLVLLVVAAIDLSFPLLIKRGIDRYIAGGNLDGLWGLCGVYLGLLIANFFLRYLQLYLTGQLGQRIMHDLRTEIFSHVQKLHLSYFDRHPVGQIMTRLTGDVEVLNQLFTSGMVSIFGDLLTLIGITAILFYLNPALAGVTLIVVPLLFIASMIFRAKVRRAFAEVRIKVAAINAFLQENISGITLVQLFGRESIHQEHFDRLNADHRDAYLRTVLYYSLFFPVVHLLESVAVALILWFGGLRVLEGPLTIGALVAFIQYSERFFRPIRDLSERYNILQGAMASSDRIFELLDTEPEIVSPEHPQSPPGPTGEVVFDQVRFGYLPDEEILRGISFRIKPGESVAIVGPTGAGKTTLSHLLSRFYEIESGRVLVDGLDVRSWSLPELRSRIGVVQQESFLWSGGLAQNVGLRQGLDPKTVEEALQIVGADGLLQRIKERGDVDVGERGNQLSVGERQLVTFARAMAYDPPVLILDEATSSVDTETETKIRNALKILLQGRTSLVIAHRLSTIQYVDRILVLHKGQVAEDGTHDELLQLGGLYARYYELEYRKQEVLL